MKTDITKKSRKMVLLSAIVFAVLLIGAVAGTLGYRYFQQAKTADPVEEEATYQELQKTVIEEEKNPYESRIDFDALHEINPDIYAWITIPGTNIDYPLLQSADQPDDYYLNTTMEGNNGLPGSIYTEKYNSTEFTDPVTLIYGHTLKDGTMFSQLHQYTDRTFFEEHPYIYIYLPDRTLQYQIFAAVALDDRYILGSYDFSKAEEFDRYIDDLQTSMTGNVNEMIDVGYGNYVITLSTCIDEFPDQRWLVNAALLDVEE